MKAALALLTLLASPAAALPVTWAEWQSIDSQTALGTITLGSKVVTVTASHTADYYFVQDSGTDFWTGDAYGQGRADAGPGNTDVVALGQGGTVTLTFSETVTGLFFGFLSWNVSPVDFSATPEVDSIGTGYFGSGTATVTGQSVSFTGDAHGVMTFSDSFARLRFTHVSEDWHGFTLGLAPVASVPLPASGLLLAGALLALRRRR